MNSVLEQKIKALPNLSGIYVMKDSAGNVIYVGKAKNLKNRVSGYFQNSAKHEKVRQMVENIADMEYFVVPSEYDAFVLERNLIAKHQPFYNILLKDGKQYPYLMIDMSKKFPKLEVTRRIKNKKAKYFGPFLYPIKAEELMQVVNYAFPIRTCNTTSDFSKKLKRACINYDLGLCSGPCIGKIDQKEYSKIIKQVINFLNGDSKEIKKILSDKMAIAAQAENFETALALKNKIRMVEALDSKIITQLTNISNFDVFGYFSDGCFLSTCVMQVRGGKILNVECFNLIDISSNTLDVLQNFLIDYYSQQVIPAKEIYCALSFSDDFQKYFNNTIGVESRFVHSQRGLKLKLVEMANLNAQKYVERTIEKNVKQESRTVGAIKRLQQQLDLKQLPVRMECYDISHLSGTDKVGSMVVFVNGEKRAKLYRKFKIKTVEGIDDFASLCEVLKRRYEEFKKQKDISFSQKPNLIVIDGGKGQLSSTSKLIKEMGFDVEIISLAKKFEEVFVDYDNTPRMLKRGSVELGLLQSIRDEAHRFAITFQREKRLKSAFSLQLEKVDGIGRKTAENIYEKFPNIKKLKEATVEDLKSIKGVNKSNINNLLQFISAEQ